MDLSETQLIESVFAGGGDMGERMRAVDWSTTVLGPVDAVAAIASSLRAHRAGRRASDAHLVGPGVHMLYNDAYGVVVGTKHPGALGRSCREVLAEAWDFIGPRFDTVFTQGQPISTLTHQLFTFHRKHYLEECYFAFSYSPIPDDTGHVGGVLTSAIDMTERVIEDRRRQVLRDLASRTAEARNEDEVWRVSAETLGDNRSSAPFAFLYQYLPPNRKPVSQASASRPTTRLHPVLVDCNSESVWRFDTALAEDCLWWTLAIAERRCRSLAGRPRRSKRRWYRSGCARHSEAAGFLVLASIRAVLRRPLPSLRPANRGTDCHRVGQRARLRAGTAARRSAG